jgi:MOSC domain-containing protein YiiM
MRFYEFESRRIVERAGIPVTEYGFAKTAAEAREAAERGTAVLEVSEPRFPCFKLGHRMGTQRFVKRFAQARRTGSYLRIVEEGELGAGDSIDVIDKPDHGVTIGLFAEAYLGDRARLGEVLEADQLSDDWRTEFEMLLAKRRAA